MSSPTPSPRTDAISERARPASEVALENEILDQSAHSPVLFLLGSSVVWLLIGSLFWLMSSVKLHHPEFLAHCPWLTFGLVKPVFTNAFLYGFGFQAALGSAIWIMVRLSRREMLYPGFCVLGGLLWNVALTAGIVAILAGYSTGYESLEIPPQIMPALFFAYFMMAVWALITFHYRQERTLYISSWYIIASFLWFPWILSTAYLLLFAFPVRGAVQAAVHWWYLNNLQTLWFTPIALGIIFYFIPKLLARPLHSLYLGMFGFWCYAVFAGFGGGMAGAPLPAWISSLTIVARAFVLLSAIAVSWNLYQTFRGDLPEVSLPLKLLIFSTGSFFIMEVAKMILATQTVSYWTNFTFVSEAMSQWGFFAFFASAAFAAVYYIVPKITGYGWPNSGLVRVHYLCLVCGILLYFFAMVAAGLIQAKGMNHPHLKFTDISRSYYPLLYLRTLSVVILTVGHLALFINLAKIIRVSCRCCRRTTEPGIAMLPVTSGGRI